MIDRVTRNLNRLAKWRTVFAGWQLGTRPDSDPECQAVRDHREATLMQRAELSALILLLQKKGVFTGPEWTEELADEAEKMSNELTMRFPGFTATDDGLAIDAVKAARTTRGWRP